jgi:hypothetical protein
MPKWAVARSFTTSWGTISHAAIWVIKSWGGMRDPGMQSAAWRNSLTSLPALPDETWALAIYDAAKMTARAAASWDNMRKKMA